MKPALLLAALIAAPFLAFQPQALALPGETGDQIKARFTNHKWLGALEEDEAGQYGGADYSARPKGPAPVTFSLRFEEGTVDWEEISYSLDKNPDFRFKRGDRGGLALIGAVYDAAIVDDFAKSQVLYAYHDKAEGLAGAVYQGKRFTYTVQHNFGATAQFQVRAMADAPRQLKEVKGCYGPAATNHADY